ncbi:phenylalanine--tRNA ligase subunit beta [candidate division KSB1 bacterium]|nr:phenylalanine--tRNA ligase subunit beta [candidate division KSB1 bacterium]RQW04838.1 MAG: phenylalanine--tRNA ligase subunit beta [candidate division KSB1 bacterium]
MPIVAISAARLNQLLGQDFDMDILVHGLQQLGCDVEDTATLALFKCPACDTPNDKLAHEEPPKRCEFCGHESQEPFEQFATDEVIRLDLLADRPDLFDPGGLSRALKGYLELESGLSEFTVGDSGIEVHVDPIMSNAGTYRPFIVCAVLDIPPLDHNSLREIMRLQEHLHWGIGRDRKLASIGVYDLDTIVGPITYSVVDPESFQFCPLGMPGVQMTPNEILEKHPKGVGYKHLMEQYVKYPILLDAKNLVLSMPPIINSDETKCKIGTKRLFIDVTGLSKDSVIDSLVTLVSALVELGGHVQTVRMNYPDGPQDTPDLTPGTIDISYEDAKKWLGLPFDRDDFMTYLRKMRLNVTPKGDLFAVSYPAFRTDIRHEVDVFEDLAIGFGYENIEPAVVKTLTIGQARPEEKQSKMIRDAMIGLGFTEIMSLLLQSVERHFSKFNLELDAHHVIVENPKTIEQKVVRNHMMTGIMETFNKNRRKAVPQKIFEIGNVIHLDKQAETGTAEYRHLAFAIIGPDTGYAEGRMIMDAILHELKWNGSYAAADHPAFTKGRSAEITNNEGLWALLGEIHPQVLNNFGLAFPIVYGELRLMQVI